MDCSIFLFILVGLVAQMIDGCLGMAYGVTSTSILLSMGFSPATASASVHLAEIFTTGISGIFHWKFGNINKKLFLGLILPGVIGGVIGAYILSSFNGEVLKPIVAVYLIIMGFRIIIKAFYNYRPKIVDIGKWKIRFLGTIGGFFDAIGGGGWGPIVTTTLVARGNHARFTIGSVNASEFFVTLAESVTFIISLGMMPWKIVVGLLVGGVIAAPFAAWSVKRLAQKRYRILLVAVGLLIIVTSIRTIMLTL